jgi:PEP-CTERM motif
MSTRSLLVGILVFSCAHAQAAMILLNGSTFDVRYDESTLGNYGNPSISGNIVFFTPTTFRAESLNGTGFSTSVGTVNFQILAKDNFALLDIALLERGDYLLRGADSFVGVTGQTRAFSLRNPMMDVSSPIASTTSLNVATGSQQNWQGTSTLNLASLALTDRQAVTYTVENLLEAYTESAGGGPKRAFIEKKFVGFSVTSSAIVSPVPEASTYLMMLVGLGVFGLFALRRKA